MGVKAHHEGDKAVCLGDTAGSFQDCLTGKWLHLVDFLPFLQRETTVFLLLLSYTPFALEKGSSL